MNTKTTEAAGERQLVSLSYSVAHNVDVLVQVAERLRERGIVMIPAVGTAYMFSDASAWTSPSGDVALRVKGFGERPVARFDEDDFTTAEGFADAIADVVLGVMAGGGSR